jgi:hypothetical protein
MKRRNVSNNATKRRKKDIVIDVLRIVLQNLDLYETTSNLLCTCKDMKIEGIKCITNLNDATAASLPWFEELGHNCFDLCPYAVRNGDLSLLDHCEKVANGDLTRHFKKTVAKQMGRCQTLCFVSLETQRFDMNIYDLVVHANLANLDALMQQNYISPFVISEIFIRYRFCYKEKVYRLLKWIVQKNHMTFLPPRAFGEIIFILCQYNDIETLKSIVERGPYPIQVAHTIAHYAFNYNNKVLLEWALKNHYSDSIKWSGNPFSPEILALLTEYSLETSIFHERHDRSYIFVHYHLFENFDRLWALEKHTLNAGCTAYLILSGRYSVTQLKEFLEFTDRNSKCWLVCNSLQLLKLENLGILDRYEYVLKGPDLLSWLPKLPRKIRIADFLPTESNWQTDEVLEFVDFTQIFEWDRLLERQDICHPNIWKRITNKSNMLEFAIQQNNIRFLSWVSNEIDLSKVLEKIPVKEITKKKQLLFWRNYLSTEQIAKVIEIYGYILFCAMTTDEIKSVGENRLRESLQRFTQHTYMLAKEKLASIFS